MQPSPKLPTRRIAVIAVIIGQLSWAGVLSAQGTVEDIASQLICLCGCNKLLNVCEMETASQMKSIISDKLSQGWSKQEIIEYMTSTYGEQVLAAPTKRGFNLTAWITPFALLAGGALVIGLLVQAWVSHRRQIQADQVSVVHAEDLEAKYGAMLEHELRELEG